MEYAKNTPEFFLGTVGAQGFGGFFDQLQSGENLSLYLLKAGPGCGKSTLMHKLAQKSQEPIQLIHCSSDPKSLDGIILNASGAAVLDATLPHAIEPTCPIAMEQVICLYNCLNREFLRSKRDSVLHLTDQSHQMHARAAAYIRTAAEILADSEKAAAHCVNFEKAQRFAERMARRYFPKKTVPGTESRRFLSAITPDGPILFQNTVQALATNTIVFHDEYGACSAFVLSHLRRLALEHGCSVITCFCSLDHQKVEHLFLPELDLALLTSNRWHSFDLPNQKNIHCTRFENKDWLQSHKKRLRFNAKAARTLLDQAMQMQREARVFHDQIEHIYQGAADFSLVDAAEVQLETELGL